MPECVILSGGPSLRRTWPEPGCDPRAERVVIALNEAGMWYTHDWYAAWDTKVALRAFRPSPRVGLACWPRWSNKYPGVMPHVERFLLPDGPHMPRNFTLPRVAALVKHLGFDIAKLYGCDWEGAEGTTTGNVYQSRRDPQRWADERKAVERYCDHFEVTFQRWTPAGFEHIGPLA